MTPDDLKRMLQAEPERPSDLMLDRLHAGELDPIQARALRQAAADDPELAGRIAARQAGWADHAEVDSGALFAAIEARIPHAEPEAVAGGIPWWQQAVNWLMTPQGGGLTLGLAALVAVVVTSRPDAVQPPAPDIAGPDIVRSKGGLQLRVFVKRAGDVTEMASGERFAEGDTLRFVIDLPRDGHVLVIHTDAQNSKVAAWPLGAEASQSLTAGRERELTGSVALDGAAGSEKLTLVRCDAPFAPAAIPPGCDRVHFDLDKGVQ
ncbi:MAG: hypothetical protein ACI9WU_001060 [Myxococcota bacterium]|jgi:hypothetical protein